ncbi:hypothetical protein CPB84DRAFT_713432 [Gymnopilus junonius]|uniref:FAD-binding domain-containing protein n=1 Tax=Gymnopilus junonius TaxID=109634 RepID=A0A9P5NSX8_GYMJU|nr:hypothetical protein CPB84DRAFT_713432 [Gymnopilus junonius]
MSTPLRIGIVGGGIGGLALALGLKHIVPEKQIHVDIYEAAGELKQVGAGITMWPRALEILKEMGLRETLERRLSLDQQRGPKNDVHVYRKSDQKEGITILELETRGSQLFYRSELQDFLLEDTSSSNINLHTSHRLVSYEEKENSVDLTFKNGETATCDLLVGADGLNSVVRGCLLAQGKNWSQEEAYIKAQPVWSGTTIYRELLNADPIRRDYPNHGALKQLNVYLGKSKHIVAYPVSQGKVINVLVFFSDPEKHGTPMEGHSNSDNATPDFISEFKGWEEDVRVIAMNLAKPSRWALQTVRPLETYVSRRVVLMGDAAHAMETHLANGVGQAIEDAYILSNIIAKALEKDSVNIPDLTKIYDTIRQPFGNFAVEASRNQGRLYELLAPGFEDVKEGECVSAERLRS